MYEEVLGIKKKKKPEPCPFCSLPADEANLPDLDKGNEDRDK
jgi:hypothetical protein